VYKKSTCIDFEKYLYIQWYCVYFINKHKCTKLQIIQIYLVCCSTTYRNLMLLNKDSLSYTTFAVVVLTKTLMLLLKVSNLTVSPTSIIKGTLSGCQNSFHLQNWLNGDWGKLTFVQESQGIPITKYRWCWASLTWMKQHEEQQITCTSTGSTSNLLILFQVTC